MASERKRKCGYRKIGGLYLVDDLSGMPCDRLPFELTVCPTCSCGIKQSRGWTWVNVAGLVGGDHTPYNLCSCIGDCPLCSNTAAMGRAGLLWIGEQFYPTVDEFLTEAREMGISRRIKSVPREFKLGETWVLLAHPKTVRKVEQPSVFDETDAGLGLRDGSKVSWHPGIFRVFKPKRIELIITEAQSNDAEFMESVSKRGLTPVVVPDGDKDHEGSLWDKKEEEAEA